MATNQIVKSEPLEVFLRKPEVIEKFIGLFKDDHEARRYIQSVLILVQSAEPGEYSLQSCSNESVLHSALRAVSLRVSVDPAVRQAWLVPRKNRKTGKVEAGLQLHYGEMRNRMMRTNLYQCINVSPVYEGETVVQDIYTGLHLVQLKSGLLTSPEQTTRFVPVNERCGKRIGLLGYCKRIRGQENTVYMSIEDIEKYVSTYNPYWTTSKAWKGDSRLVMEQKTVLLQLIRKEDLGDPRMGEIKEIMEEAVVDDQEDVIEAEAEYVPEQQERDEKETDDSKSSGDEKKEAEPVPPARPYAPADFKVAFEKLNAVTIQAYEKNGLPLAANENERKVLASIIDGIFGDKGLSRHPFCTWLCGVGSTKEMTAAQVKALFHVMGIRNDSEHPAAYNDPPSAISIQEFRNAYQELVKPK